MANTKSKAHKRRGYTAADKRAIKIHLTALCDMGCIPCFIVDQVSVAGVHHIRQGLGMGQRSSDLRTLGLCYEHHQSEARDHVSIHGKPKLCRFLFGTELDLLTHTLDQLYPDGIYPSEYTEKIVDELNSYR
jgi:hypothetical protein